MAVNSQAIALLDELKARGLFHNLSDADKFVALPAGAGVYIGFDPTATSLHLGNYIQLTLLRRFANYGFTPYAVLGGATGMIGDPAGRVTERASLDAKVLAQNKRAIHRQLDRFKLRVLDNASWYRGVSVLTFLRMVGKHVSVSYMLAKESVKTRLETGLSFTEFTYQLLQGWDFQVLYATHGVHVQLGGSDQWGNITTGLELIRKFHGEAHHAVGLTVPLLTTSSGAKFGKSAGNALWLDARQTSPFALYQFLLHTPDRDIAQLLAWLTFTPLPELAALVARHEASPAQQIAQRFFAEQVTTDIHGAKAAHDAAALSTALYGHRLKWPLRPQVIKSLAQAVPTFANLSGPVLQVLVATGLAPSQRAARDLIASGGIYLNDVPVTLATEIKTPPPGGANLLRKGKRTFALITYAAPLT